MSRILIVDDVQITQRIIKNILGNSHEFTTAVCGLSALEAFHKALKQKQPFELIFLDILIPNKDGLEVLRHIREYERDSDSGESAQVLVMTHLKSREVEKNARDAGCDAFVQKPIQRNEIINFARRQKATV